MRDATSSSPRLGDIIHHQLRKTITEGEHSLFCAMTLNPHPLHIDQDFAESTEFGQRVVAGTLTLSLAVGISVGDISINAVANLGYQDVRHLAPVFLGDTLHCCSEVLEHRASASRLGNCIVTVKTQAQNQQNQPVLEFRRSILVSCDGDHAR